MTSLEDSGQWEWHTSAMPKPAAANGEATVRHSGVAANQRLHITYTGCTTLGYRGHQGKSHAAG
jgi:hypothetical protein